MNVSKMPPLLSDIICGFARHITCTQVNILLLIYSGCLGIPVFVLNGKLKGVFNLFVPKMLLISHGFFCFFVVFFPLRLMETLKVGIFTLQLHFEIYCRHVICDTVNVVGKINTKK